VTPRERGGPSRQERPSKKLADLSVQPTRDTAITDRSPLRQTLDDAIAESNGSKLSMKDLTVLSPQRDPFRLDTRAKHRDGEWLATTAAELGLGDRKIHLRGLHYMVIGRPKPDGLPYTNTDDDWLWLSEDCGKAARFLGYIPFDQIVDQRNTPPTVRIYEHATPRPYVSVGVKVDIPNAEDIEPHIGAYYVAQGETHGGFSVAQPRKIVMVGEKSSLEEVLGPIARAVGADLYLPTGEMSDTLIHQMSKVGAADGRPMVVLYFSDADPAGWQMPISVARKLQAFKAGLFPELDFEVHRVGLTPDQVREYGLPSTPLKDTELRGDAWRAAMGVAQTEVDALASLRPDLLRRLARDAIAPFYDFELDRRVQAAYEDWRERAQEALDDVLDQDHLDRLRTEATAKLEELREQIDAINDELRIDVSDLDLPPIVVPEADLTGKAYPMALLDSSWSFTKQCRRLIASKAYRIGGGS
jgi:hypothetical protein